METEVMSLVRDNPVVLDLPKRSLNEYWTDYEKHWNASRKAAGKTTESVLKLCRVVFEASVVLDEKEFRKFRDAHKELKSGSMVSQVKKVGANYERLAKHAESLPSSWYHLYLLSGIEDSVIEHAVKESKTLHPLTTQREIERIIAGDVTEGAETETDEPPQVQHQDECSFKIRITSDTFDVSAFEASLNAFLEQQKDAFGWSDFSVKQKGASHLTSHHRYRPSSRRRVGVIC